MTNVYYFPASDISILPNAHDEPNDVEILIQGAERGETYVDVYDPRIQQLNTNADGSYQRWRVESRNRRLATDDTYNIYLRVPKRPVGTNMSDRAYIVFSTYDYELTPNTSTTTELTQQGNDGKYYTWPPISARQAEAARVNCWWIKIGTISSVSAGRVVNISNGVLGTPQYNNRWEEEIPDLPLRVEVTNDITDSGTPHVRWGHSITFTPRLVERWADDVTERVTKWGITRDSGDVVADPIWNSAHAAGFTGSIEMFFAEEQNDLGRTGSQTTFTFTAYDDNGELASTSVSVTHDNLSNWTVELDNAADVITVDALGNVIGGLWVEEEDETTHQTYRTYRLRTSVSAKRGNDPLALAPAGAAPTAGQYQIYPQQGDCTVEMDHGMVRVVAIDNIHDGVSETVETIDFDAMRRMKEVTVTLRIDVEGEASFIRTFHITIYHDPKPFIDFQLQPETATVVYDPSTQTYDELSNGGYIDCAIAAVKGDEEVDLHSVTPTDVSGNPLASGYTIQRLLGSDVWRITALPAGMVSGSVVQFNILVKYAGVAYEGVRRLTITKVQKPRSVTSVTKHYLVTNVAYATGTYPAKTLQEWTTVAADAQVSEAKPYLWTYETTTYSYGAASETNPVLSTTYAPPAVSYELLVSPTTIGVDTYGVLVPSNVSITTQVKKSVAGHAPTIINDGDGCEVYTKIYRVDNSGTQILILNTKNKAAASSRTIENSSIIGHKDAAGFRIQIHYANGDTLLQTVNVPIVRDGDSPVRYFLETSPTSLALSSDGNTFSTGGLTASVVVTMKKQIGATTANADPQNDQVAIKYRLRYADGTSTYVEGPSGSTAGFATNPYTISGISLLVRAVDVELWHVSVLAETFTVVVNQPGVRGYQGPEPRRREWTEGLVWYTGAAGERYADICLLKDSSGNIQAFRCIQSFSNVSTSADYVPASICHPVTGSQKQLYWADADAEYKFVATDFLLSNYILAKSGRFDGLHVNDLWVGRNSHVGGFIYNEPHKIKKSEVPTLVNPLDYGILDHELSQAAKGDVAPAAYATRNILFPNCGSSIILDDAGYDSREQDENLYDLCYHLEGQTYVANEWPANRINIPLPFYAPFAGYHYNTDEGHPALSHEDVATVITSNLSKWDLTRDDFIVQQIINGYSISFDYLGASFVVQNRLQDHMDVVIYGVRGVRFISDDIPTVSGVPSYFYYTDYDPWNRSTFYWQADDDIPPASPYIFVDNLPMSLTEMQRLLEVAGMRFMDPGTRLPRIMQDVLMRLGLDSKIKLTDMVMAQDFPGGSTDGTNGLGAFKLVDSSNPLSFTNSWHYQDIERDVPFRLPAGYFVRLVCTYEDGMYFWRIAEFGPNPTPPSSSSSS